LKGILLKGKRVLVTGASGFVGKHLTKELKGHGAEVLALDVRSNDSIDIRDWQRIKDMAGRVGNLDLVYHLAALMLVPYSFENPREVYDVNVSGTLNILELCRLYNVHRIVFASSYVYGPPQYLPVDEKHPLNPTSPYARSKAIAEGLCKAFHEDYGLKCTILRPFNIYGEGQNNSFLIPSIFKQISDGKIELMDPEPKRDFIYIADAIEAYIKAGEYTKTDFEIFNIGSGLSYSVEEIVSRILEAWGQQVKVTYKYLRRKNEIMDVVANVRKANQELNWEPKVDLKEGLTKYIEWYKGSKKVTI
jgi:UDP-glucose 4-epimerase